MKLALRLLITFLLLILITSCFPSLVEGPVIRDEQETLDLTEELESFYNLSPQESDTIIKKKKSFSGGTLEYSAECRLKGSEFINRVIIERENRKAAERYRAMRAALIESQKKKGLLYRNSEDFYSYGELSHYMEFYTREAREHPRFALFTFRRGRVVYSMQIGGERAGETARFEELVKSRVKVLESKLSGSF